MITSSSRAMTQASESTEIDQQGAPSARSALRGGAWGMLAGTIGGLCCVGPSAAVLLGLGSSSALAGLALDRTLTLAGGAALLCVGLALAVRNARTCPMPGAARWKRPALMLATFAFSYLLLGWALPNIAASRVEAANPAPASAPVTPVSLHRVTLSIAKMECPPCAAHARSLLKRQPFVSAFFAESGIDQVTVDYDSRQIDAAGIAALFPRYYGVTLVSDVGLRKG